MENVPIPRVKPCWDGKELVLLAREELCLTLLSEKNINYKLANKFPHHSLESIKGVRHEAIVKYWKVFQDLVNGDMPAVSLVMLSSSNGPVNDVSLQMDGFTS